MFFYTIVFFSCVIYLAIGYARAKLILNAYKDWSRHPVLNHFLLPDAIFFGKPGAGDIKNKLENTPDGLTERSELIARSMFLWAPIYVLEIIFLLMLCTLCIIIFWTDYIPQRIVEVIKRCNNCMKV